MLREYGSQLVPLSDGRRTDDGRSGEAENGIGNGAPASRDKHLARIMINGRLRCPLGRCPYGYQIIQILRRAISASCPYLGLH